MAKYIHKAFFLLLPFRQPKKNVQESMLLHWYRLLKIKVFKNDNFHAGQGKLSLLHSYLPSVLYIDVIHICKKQK